MKTALNNVLLPTLFKVVNNVVRHCYASLQASLGLTMLNNIVDNIEQCCRQNIVLVCYHQARTGCSFLAVCLLLTHLLHGKKLGHCNKLLKTGCNSVVGATLFLVVNDIVQHCYT